MARSCGPVQRTWWKGAVNSAPILPAQETETDVQSGNRSPGLQEQLEVKSELVSVLPFKALFFYEPSILMTEHCWTAGVRRCSPRWTCIRNEEGWGFSSKDSLELESHSVTIDLAALPPPLQSPPHPGVALTKINSWMCKAQWWLYSELLPPVSKAQANAK